MQYLKFLGRYKKNETGQLNSFRTESLFKPVLAGTLCFSDKWTFRHNAARVDSRLPLMCLNAVLLQLLGGNRAAIAECCLFWMQRRCRPKWINQVSNKTVQSRRHRVCRRRWRHQSAGNQANRSHGASLPWRCTFGIFAIDVVLFVVAKIRSKLDHNMDTYNNGICIYNLWLEGELVFLNENRKMTGYNWRKKTESVAVTMLFTRHFSLQNVCP